MFGDPGKTSREQRLFLVRALVLVLVGLAALGFLTARIAYLTVARGPELYSLSEDNLISQEKIAAPRGPVTDRYGRVLATSETRYNLSVSPFKIQADQLARTLEVVRTLCPGAAIPEVEAVMRLRPRWKQVPLASNLTMREAMPLMERQALLAGLRIDQTFLRIYPCGRTAGMLTGYVGRIGERTMDSYLEQGYDPDDIVGKAAAEKQYEDLLRGEKGVEIVSRDARGQVLGTRVERNAVRGARLTLTLDLDLQTTATAILAGRPGVIVAMDPRNGEILALVSSPDYDPNAPEQMSAGGNSGWNKVLRTHYAPGSIFKLVTATAWLESGGSPDRRVNCGGRIQVGNTYMHCDLRSGHGSLDMRQAIERSCNLYFYQLARDLGTEKMVATALEYGFGKPTGIGLLAPGESPGRLGDPASRNLAELMMMGIGQGRLISTTPLQLVNAYAALANGGRLQVPQILRGAEFPGGKTQIFRTETAGQIPLKPEQREVLLAGFRDVTSTNWGTGRHARFDPAMKVAGKTSSAQRAGESDAGFICFAPWDNPEICVYVLLEAAGHGGEFAAPVAKQVLDEYYRLRFRRTGEAPPATPGKAGAAR